MIPLDPKFDASTAPDPAKEQRAAQAARKAKASAVFEQQKPATVKKAEKTAAIKKKKVAAAVGPKPDKVATQLAPDPAKEQRAAQAARKAKVLAVVEQQKPKAVKKAEITAAIKKKERAVAVSPKPDKVAAQLAIDGIKAVVGGVHQTATANRLATYSKVVGKIEAGVEGRIEARETAAEHPQPVAKPAETQLQHAQQLERAYGHQPTLADFTEEKATAVRELKEMKEDVKTHAKAFLMSKSSAKGKNYLSSKDASAEAEKAVTNAADAAQTLKTEKEDENAYLAAMNAKKPKEPQVKEAKVIETRTKEHAMPHTVKVAAGKSVKRKLKGQKGVSKAKVAKAIEEEHRERIVSSFAGQARAERLGGVEYINGQKVSAAEEAQHHEVAVQAAGKAAAETVIASMPRDTTPQAVVRGAKVNPYSIIPPVEAEEFLQIPDGIAPSSLGDSLPKESAGEARAQASAVKWSKKEAKQTRVQQQHQAMAKKFIKKQEAATKIAEDPSTVAAEAAARRSAEVAKIEASDEEQASEANARKSASVAALMAVQQQVARDVKFLPRMSAKLHSLQDQLGKIAKRDKYATDVASAISKGMAGVLAGKGLPSQRPAHDANIEVSEGGFPTSGIVSDTLHRMSTESDGEVEQRAKLDAAAYDQAVTWQNQRTAAFDAAQDQISSSTASIQEKQAAALALQHARRQDDQRLALMHAISKVHATYQHDLAEAQGQAKAKAMATLQNFARNLEDQKKAGQQLAIKDSFADAQKRAPKVHKIIAPKVPKAVAYARLGETKRVAAKLKQAQANAKAVAYAQRSTTSAAHVAPKTPKKAAAPKKAPKKAVSAPVVAKARATTTSAAVVAKPLTKEEKIERAEEKAQAAAIAQAGVERALVDTAKKIKKMKAQVVREVRREQAYFQHKEEVAVAHNKAQAMKKEGKLKHINSVAEKNLEHEAQRLKAKTEGEKSTIAAMKKIRAAALQEKGGIEKTAMESKEMAHAAMQMKGQLQEQLRNFKRPSDITEYTSDLGETVTISGHKDLGEGEDEQLTDDVTMGDVTPSAGAKSIELKDEKATNADLAKIKGLEKSALSSIHLFLEAAHTTAQESARAEAKDARMASLATRVIKKLASDVRSGNAMESHAETAEVKIVKAPKVEPYKATMPLKKPLKQPAEEEDLGESLAVASATPLGSDKLKAEQFALVNAQTKLNQVTKLRQRRENALAKRWGHKEKVDVATEVLSLKHDMEKLHTDTNNEIKATTNVDNFLVKAKTREQQEHKLMAKIKRNADQSVHDEFIATQDAAKAMKAFKATTDKAAGFISGLSTPALRKVVGRNPHKAAGAATKAFVAAFVQKHEPADPHRVNPMAIQPTMAKAKQAMAQEKKDEKVASAFGRKLEKQQEAGMKPASDLKGNGAHDDNQVINPHFQPAGTGAPTR